jgi:hypothetical protein
MIAPTQPHADPGSPVLRVFGTSLRVAWLVVAVLTMLSEVIPFPLLIVTPHATLSYSLFYAYKTAKVVLFLVLGYLTPFTFWRFNSLTAGLLFAALSAALVESLQGLGLSHGHRFSWLELAVKLGLVLVGFTLALEARYEGSLKLGKRRILLAGPHLPRRD